ncbi:MAG TPA: serine/threonine-protein kinase [Hyphomicrobiaceae bacterium]|nr:serine/threonine-protein kinase [Hyphomicrobiaceae bacterium]
MIAHDAPQTGENGEFVGSGARVALPSGTQVGLYVIERVLGAGGFGITYLASHELLSKKFAIKEYFPIEFSYRTGQTVRPTKSGAETYHWGLDRFMAEARALARFKNPAIVDVIDIFEANETAYMVLAYERGMSMRDWLEQLGRTAEQHELDRLLVPLLDALEEIHSYDLLHRDIAPDNILIREDGSPVLIDFGAARQQVRGVGKAISVLVKSGYSPPEQYSSAAERQGPWSDIYALSATVYRAITGYKPPDAAERLLADLYQPAATLVRGSFRREFLEAVDLALTLSPSERPQSVPAWRRALFLVGENRVSSKRMQSLRPDLSELDVAATPDQPERIGRTRSQTMPLALAFGAGGAVVGTFASFLFSSVMTPSCFADSCFLQHSLPFAGIGCLVGVAAGVRVAGSRFL